MATACPILVSPIDRSHRCPGRSGANRGLRSYGFDMPPCMDVYVLVRGGDRPTTLSKFITRYVDLENPGDPRLEPFIRVLVDEQPVAGDAEELATLRRGDPDTHEAISLYVNSTAFYGAIVTLTEEGDLVLGLRIDDPEDTAIETYASQVLTRLMDEFRGEAGIAGAELPPPQSLTEWTEAAYVLLRVGSA